MIQKIITDKQSSFEQFCSQFDWYDFKILGSFLTKLPFPNDVTTQSLHSIWLLFKRKEISISKMTISRRLNRMVILGLLRKLSKTNPVFYEIAKGQEEIVRNIVYFKNAEKFELMEMDNINENDI